MLTQLLIVMSVRLIHATALLIVVGSTAGIWQV